jgi:hypothetical protein
MIKLEVILQQTTARNANMKVNGANIEKKELILNHNKELLLLGKYIVI